MEDARDFLKIAVWVLGIVTIILVLVSLSFEFYEALAYPHTTYVPLAEKARNFAALGLVGLLWTFAASIGLWMVKTYIEENAETVKGEGQTTESENG